MADQTLYRHVGDGQIDPAVWPDSGKTNAAGERLYTFTGDSVPGDATGTSEQWVVDTAAAPAPSPKPTPSTPTTGEDTAETVAESAPDAPVSGDRVQMLSIRADGTPDQTNPTLIGDVNATLEATTAQLTQQAVAAVDTDAALEQAGEEPVQDPGIASAAETHEQAASDAADRAQALVDGLPSL